MKFDNRIYFGFAIYDRLPDGRWALRLNWRRIVALAIFLGVVAYLGLGALLLWRDRAVRGLDDATFADMLIYPFSREERQRRREAYSESLMEKAKQESDPGRALSLVRAGLMQDASNPDGRIFFSHALFSQRRSREALNFLQSGVENALDHPDYIPYFVHQSLAHYADDMLAEPEKELREHEALTEKNRLALAFGAAQADLFRGRFKSLEARLSSPPIAGTRSADFLRARAAEARGDYLGAAEFYRRVLAWKPSPEIALMIAENLYAAGRQEEARRFWRAAVEVDGVPARVRIRALDTLKIASGAERAEMRRKILAKFLDAHGKDVPALGALAAFAAENGDVEIASICFSIAGTELFPNLADFYLAWVETLLRAGNTEAALAEFARIGEDETQISKKFAGKETAFHSLRAVALLASGDETLGGIVLEKAMLDARTSPKQCIALARLLFDTGHRYRAFDVLKNALERAPEHPLVLENLVDFSMRSRDAEIFSAYALRLANSRRPPFAFLERMLAFSRSDAMLFSPAREKIAERLMRMTR